MKSKKSIKRAVLGLLLFVLGVMTPTVIKAAEPANAPSVDAKGALVADLETGKVLVDQNGSERLPIASMTKLITVYLIYQAIEEGQIFWDDTVPISDYVATISNNMELSNVPLSAYEVYTVKELLESVLVYSANGSAIALAELIAGSEEDFVTKMNDLVSGWGINDAILLNASGLPNKYRLEKEDDSLDPDAENEMSARDVATVAYHLLTDFPEVLDITAQPTVDFRADANTTIEMHSYNHMLEGYDSYYEDVDGLKTGTTDGSGASFTGTAKKDDFRVITVVIGSSEAEERFHATAQLLDFTFKNFKKTTIANAGDPVSHVKSIPVIKGKEKEVGISYGSNVVMMAPIGTVEMDLEAVFTPDKGLTTSDGKIEAPIEKGEKLGKVALTVTDDLGFIAGRKSEAESDAVASDSVAKANIFVRAGRVISQFVKDLWSSAREFINAIL